MISHHREGIRAWPVLSNGFRRVLDIGCGNGDALDRAGQGFLAVGVDIDHGALSSGTTRFTQVRFSRAVGEALPFKDGVFDAVLSRVALPLMNIPVVLGEAARVLRRGGEAWFAFHRFAFVRSELKTSLRTLNVKRTMFLGYVIVNGLALHVMGRTFRFPFNRTYRESFQTEGGVRRALERAGFEDIRVVDRSPFIVTARRR
jgi:ubiquinone/menaquinone biosynthesis C-methylase UbiE